MEIVFFFNPLTKQASECDVNLLIEEYVRTGCGAGMFNLKELLSLSVQSEQRPSLEWFESIEFYETAHIPPDDHKYTLVRKGRGREVVVAGTKTPVLTNLGKPIHPKFSLTFNTHTCVKEMLIMSEKEKTYVERKLRNANELILWDGDTKYLKCFLVACQVEENAVNVVKVTEVDLDEALAVLRRRSTANRKVETKENEKIAMNSNSDQDGLDGNAKKINETQEQVSPDAVQAVEDNAPLMENAEDEEDVEDNAPLMENAEDKEDEEDNELIRELLEVTHSSTTSPRDREDVFSFEFENPLTPRSVSAYAERKGDSDEDELEKIAEVQKIGEEQKIDEPESFDESDTVEEEKRKEQNEKEKEKKKKKKERKQEKKKRDEKEMNENVEEPMNKRKHFSDKVKKTDEKRRRVDDPGEQHWQPPQLDEILSEQYALESAVVELSAREYLNVHFRGQILRSIDWSRVDVLKRVDDKGQFFSLSDASRPAIICRHITGGPPKKALLVEANHRTAALLESLAAGELSEDFLNSSLSVIKYLVPKDEFKHIWDSATPVLRTEPVKPFNWRSLSARTCQTVLSEFRHERNRTAGQFTLLQTTMLALSLLESLHGEDAREVMRRSASRRGEATKWLLNRGVVQTNGSRQEGIPVAIFCSGSLTRSAALHCLARNTLPTGSRAHERLRKCSTKDDKATAKLLLKVNEGRLKVDRFLCSLDLILSGKTAGSAKSSSTTTVAGVEMKPNINDVPPRSNIVAIHSIPNINAIVNSHHQLLVVKPSNDALREILANFGDRIRKGSLMKSAFGGSENTFYITCGENVKPEKDQDRSERCAASKLESVFLKSRGSKARVLKEPIFAVKGFWM